MRRDLHLEGRRICKRDWCTQLKPDLLNNLEPILFGLLAASLAYLGWTRIADQTLYHLEIDSRLEARRMTGLQRSHSRESLKFINHLQMIGTFLLTLILTLAITTSIQISIAISILFATLPYIVSAKRSTKLRKIRDRSWPVAIDDVISSLQAGQSISEAVKNLAQVGPKELQVPFQRIQEGLADGKNLSVLLEGELHHLDSGVADQTITALLLAKEYGGRDVTNTLRLLSNFLREENEAREEIETRFGWVQNSAILGAVAPWLLLALLSTQRSTVEAFSTSAGILVLAIGVIATVIAFIWMDRVSQLPEPPRPLRPSLKLVGLPTEIDSQGKAAPPLKRIRDLAINEGRR